MVIFATMRIAVNTRFLQKNKLEGYGYYIHELMSRISRNHPEHEFLFLFDREFSSEFVYSNNVKTQIIKPQARFALTFRIWYDISLAWAAKKFKADILVSLDGFCSLTTVIPQVLAVHDLAFLHYPKFIAKHHLWFYKMHQKKFLNKAKAVVTVSNFSKQDIVKHYKIDERKINIVYNAARDVFKPVEERTKHEIKQHYSRGHEYFLFVGGVHPRKNLMRLIKAFSIFKKRQLSSMKLLVVGRLAWQYDDIVEKLKTYKYRDDVILLDYLPDNELAKVTASAYALVYPSLFEGFGVPIVEAMACGTPVLCSNITSMPEIADNAGWKFNPEDENDIAQKMMQVYKDETLRSRLIELGFERVKHFSWNESAENLWKIMEITARKNVK